MVETGFTRAKNAGNIIMKNQIGITGITVTNVMGCGTQKGRSEHYRGVPVEMTLLPKIFVYDVENVVKVRTGEEGYDALQDDV